MTTGRIHSIETMGLVDGPGVRTVVFMQGCKLRCQYCHNPDTWSMNGGQEITVQELFNKVKKYKSYYKASGGGVTISGGDPLLQPEFVQEFLKLCKEEGIHTCIDTSGYGLGDYEGILKYTDLVLLDIKHIEEDAHRKLTGLGRHGFLEFVETLKKRGTKLWVRHVVVPGITDEEQHIANVAQYINGLGNVERVELLPYHNHGENKYKEMNIHYRLSDTPCLSKDRLNHLYDVLYKYLDKSETMPVTDRDIAV